MVTLQSNSAHLGIERLALDIIVLHGRCTEPHHLQLPQQQPQIAMRSLLSATRSGRQPPAGSAHLLLLHVMLPAYVYAWPGNQTGGLCAVGKSMSNFYACYKVPRPAPSWMPR
jgi:hypothetical protein